MQSGGASNELTKLLGEASHTAPIPPFPHSLIPQGRWKMANDQSVKAISRRKLLIVGTLATLLHDGHLRDRLQVLQRVDAHAGVQMRVDHQHKGYKQKRVAIWRRAPCSGRNVSRSPIAAGRDRRQKRRRGRQSAIIGNAVISAVPMSNMNQ